MSLEQFQHLVERLLTTAKARLTKGKWKFFCFDYLTRTPPSWSSTQVLVARIITLLLPVGLIAGVVIWTLSIRVSATPKGRVGIWVTQFRGDSPNHNAQRFLTHELNVVLNAHRVLRDKIEVRELPDTIKGVAPEDRLKILEKMSRRYNAQVIVWGDVTKLLDEPSLNISLFTTESVFTTRSSVPLRPELKNTFAESLHYISQISQQRELSLAPDRVRRPIETSKVLVTLAALKAGEFESATALFNQINLSTVDEAVRVDAVTWMAGFIFWGLYLSKEQATPPEQAAATLKQAAHWWERAATSSTRDNLSRAGLLSNLGDVYITMAERGIEPEYNISRATSVLDEAERLISTEPNRSIALSIKLKRAHLHRFLSSIEPDSRTHIEKAIATLNETWDLIKELGIWQLYSRIDLQLGMLHAQLAISTFDKIDFTEHWLFAIAHLMGAASTAEKSNDPETRQRALNILTPLIQGVNEEAWAESEEARESVRRLKRELPKLLNLEAVPKP